MALLRAGIRPAPGTTVIPSLSHLHPLHPLFGPLPSYSPGTPAGVSFVTLSASQILEGLAFEPGATAFPRLRVCERPEGACQCRSA